MWLFRPAGYESSLRPVILTRNCTREFFVTLRFRLIALVSVALSISLALGGAIACRNASRSVRTEIKSALLVGRQTVENAIDGLRNSRDPQHDLEDFVLSFAGNRHLR